MNNDITGKYCYSTDEESYRGVCDTPEIAAGEAIDDLESDAVHEFEQRTYWVARIVHPIDAHGADSLAMSIGENVEEQLVMWCDEEVGAEEPCLDISVSDRKKLGEMIVQFFRQNSAVQYYGITDVVEHTCIIGMEDFNDEIRRYVRQQMGAAPC